jgi:hypothetical protein
MEPGIRALEFHPSMVAVSVVPPVRGVILTLDVVTSERLPEVLTESQRYFVRHRELYMQSEFILLLGSKIYRLACKNN